jgi:teichuronic acid biosynthesis glycosyltransferase TuaC
MNLLTVSNLYPWPSQPTRGLYNAQLFRALHEELRAGGAVGTSAGVFNLCPVADWRVWRWLGIRAWTDPTAAPFVTRYVPSFHLPVVGRNVAAAFQFGALARAVAQRPQRFDAVLAAWLYADGVAAARLAGRLGARCWIMALGTDTFHLGDPVRRRAILDACARAAGIVCVARPLAARLVAAGVDAAKVHTVANGVDSVRFRFVGRETATAELLARAGGDEAIASVLAWRRDPAARIALFVGNLVPVKGPDVLLKAWSRVAADGSPARLAVIGDGPLRKRLEAAARAAGLSDTVRFLGTRPHDEIPLWMNWADGLCLPSRSEGMPNVVVEALACGLPVAAARVGNCGELLAGEDPAESFAPGDADELAAALARLLGRSVPETARRSAAERNGARFSWARQAGAILDLMRT